MFTFDPSKCKGNVEKCVAFWRSIYESELKPVDCSLYKPPAKSESEIKNMVNKEKIKEEVIEKKTIPWSEALKELQRRRMDKAAVRIFLKVTIVTTNTILVESSETTRV